MALAQLTEPKVERIANDTNKNPPSVKYLIKKLEKQENAMAPSVTAMPTITCPEDTMIYL